MPKTGGFVLGMLFGRFFKDVHHQQTLLRPCVPDFPVQGHGDFFVGHQNVTGRGDRGVKAAKSVWTYSQRHNPQRRGLEKWTGIEKEEQQRQKMLRSHGYIME
jgi:hypothetical protein